MSQDRQTIFLVGPTQKQFAKQCIDAAPADYVCQIKQKTRTLEQSAKFHAICNDIAKQKEFGGKLRTPEQWKLLLVSGHAIATKRDSEIVPGLEGEWVNLRESTAQMSIKRLSSLIEYSLAWCADNSIDIQEK